jgi:hypothetical protein
MLKDLTQQQVELALRVIDQAVQTEEMGPFVVPESLQHLTTAEWDQLCLVMESLVTEQSRAVIH